MKIEIDYSNFRSTSSKYAAFFGLELTVLVFVVFSGRAGTLHFAILLLFFCQHFFELIFQEVLCVRYATDVLCGTFPCSSVIFSFIDTDNE